LAEIRKLLVANRGEIAIRVFRTCRDLRITTVAVFSDADRAALHVRMADEAYRIGPAPASVSYLDQGAILDVAKRCGADAIHPGYGFLSENPEFAEQCGEAGFIFVGPPAAAIRAMGDKAAARKLMLEVGVPMVPGAIDVVATVEAAREVAADIGYPVLVKAVAGGGGKGMRVVLDADSLAGSFEASQREATAAFGDGRVYIERYIEKPRHIEIQVMADTHGNAIHLFERECSIQRRHQKVIEESPSCIVDDDLRERMGEAAVKATLACGYTNAGTVEFLLDSSKAFYFMEMNTRLQVEHPVTEAVTGIALVREQIRVAEGEPLAMRQEDLELRGHAIECRVYADDPSSDFLPDPGTLVRHAPPAGPGVRVDAGVDEGSEIPIYYDPMVSKVITWGADRDEAIRRMLRALAEYQIAGVRTTIPFCKFVLCHPAFQAGHFSTHFVDDEFTPGSLETLSDSDAAASAIAAVLVRNGSGAVKTPSPGAEGEWSRWVSRRRKGWRR